MALPDPFKFNEVTHETVYPLSHAQYEALVNLLVKLHTFLAKNPDYTDPNVDPVMAAYTKFVTTQGLATKRARQAKPGPTRPGKMTVSASLKDKYGHYYVVPMEVDAQTPAEALKAAEVQADAIVAMIGGSVQGFQIGYHAALDVE